MAAGVSRNRAREEAGLVQQHNRFAERFNRNNREREWAAPHGIRVITPGTPTKRPRINNTSYREHWDRAGEYIPSLYRIE
jgi:hypothetical protein